MLQTLSVLLACLVGADAKINAPATAPAGQLLLIDGSESTGSLMWTVADPEVSLLESRDKKQIVVFVPTPRKTLITLQAKDSAGESTDYHVLRSEGTDSTPAPKPDKPKPSPAVPGKPLPPGTFNISQPCCDEACKIKSGQRKADADLISTHLAELRDRIRSDKTLDCGDLPTMQTEVMRATKGLPMAIKTRWLDWATWWSRELCGRAAEKQLATSTAWVAFLDETILGLKAVK